MMSFKKNFISGVFGIAAVAAVVSEDATKYLLRKALQTSISVHELVVGPKLSTTLMQKCLKSDTKPFGREDLDAKFPPEYAATIQSLIIAELKTQADPRQNLVERMWRRLGVDSQAEEEPENTVAKQILSGGKGEILIDTENGINFMNGFFRNEYPLNSTLSDINGSELSTSGIMMDFSRAMGNFKVSCDNYRCNIIDYFDFEFDPDETPLENIAEATGMAFRGRYDEASVAIGRMYCQELDNEQPSKTSIPINIEISIR